MCSKKEHVTSRSGGNPCRCPINGKSTNRAHVPIVQLDL